MLNIRRNILPPILLRARQSFVEYIVRFGCERFHVFSKFRFFRQCDIFGIVYQIIQFVYETPKFYISQGPIEWR